MQTKSSSRLTCDQSSNPSSSTNTNPKGRNRRSSKQRVENSNLEEHLPPVVTMADNCTMAELLRAPTEGYAEAIVVPSILAKKFELKYSLINMMTTDQFFELDRYKDLLCACPHHGFTELHQLDTFYNALNSADQDSLNAAAGGIFLERCTQDVLTIIENKSKVRNSQNKPIVSQVKACDVNSNFEIAKLTHAVNQQTSDMTAAMTAMLKQFQATQPPSPVKAIEEICVTCGCAHPYYQCLAAGGNTFLESRDNIQEYVSAVAVNYNQAQQNQNFHLNELEKIKKMNEVNMKAMQTQIDMVNNELRNEMKTSIQTSLSNQTNEIKNMMASLLQINTASGSGSLPSNTIPNPKGKLKAITTRSGLVTDGPTVPTPPKSSTPEVDERVEETFTDPDLAEYTIKKMLKALLSNKEKLQELANIPLNENCLAVILKKLPEKLKDPGKFLIPCGFSELKWKALADLGASINLMPLSIWKRLGLPELIPTRMTLEVANNAICTPAGISRDVFVPVNKFTFPADFVIIDYESDPKVPLILGRPFLRTARALINVHGEERILRDGSANPAAIFVDPIPEMFTDDHAFDYSSPLIFYVYDDEFLEVESDSVNVYDDPFDSKGEKIKEVDVLPSTNNEDKEDKIKESKLLINELDLPRSSDFLPSPECDSFLYEDFSEVDDWPLTNNEDKVFKPGILIHENLSEVTVQVTPDKNVKKIFISNASLILEDFDPPLYELPFYKEVLGFETLLSFSFKNEEKVFKPRILTSKGVHTSLLLELSHQGPKAFK
nr:reverse transcriptase domain-containing protein [Tanacetum cinerariifolium]